MLARRLGVGTLSFLVVLSICVSPVSPDTGDKQLARVKGVVGYQASDTSPFKAIFGQFDLPDDAYAVTKPNGQAVLRLKDSSEIDIGENTKVQVGQFNSVTSGGQNSIALLNGALHFNIRHPVGGQSNYKFTTATSQIAVRGTEAFLVAGASGTQVACVSCAVGDVTVQVGNQTISLVTGQTATIVGTSAATAVATVSSNTLVNNPAINQFNNGSNPFNANPAGNTVDPTNSLSGTGTSSVGTGISGATVGAVAGGAAAAGVAVAATSNKGSPTPTPTQTPVPVVSPGPLVVQVSYPGASASFPVGFNWPFSQAGATGQATATCGPPNLLTCTVVQSLSGGTLNGAINGSISGPGTFTVGASASGYTVPVTSFKIYGGVTPSATVLNFTDSTPQQLVLTQNPAGAQLSTSVSCATGASMTVAPTNGPSPLTVKVTPVSAPAQPGSTAACTLTITGQGGTAASSSTVQVNITSTAIGISSHKRKPL
jgi:hypothetical protein